MIPVKTLSETDDLETARSELRKLLELLNSTPMRRVDLGAASSGCIQALQRVSKQWGDTDEAVAREVCSIVTQLNKTKDDPCDIANRATMGSFSIPALVSSLLGRWQPTSLDVSAASLEAIFTLARDENNRLQFYESEACQNVCAALKTWGESSQSVAWSGCKAALNLACDERNQILLGKHGCCDIICKVVSKFAPISLEIAWDGSWAISNLAFADDNKRHLGRAGAVQALIVALQAWPDNREVALNACCALHNLAYAKENFDALRDANACAVVVNVLEKFIADDEVLESALWAVWVLAFHPYTGPLLTSNRVLLLIVRALQTIGRFNRIVAWHGCGAIWAIVCSHVSRWPRPIPSAFMQLLKMDVVPAIRACTWNGMQNEARQVCYELFSAEAALGLRRASIEATKSSRVRLNQASSADREDGCDDDRLATPLDTLRRQILFRACVQEDWNAAGLLLDISSREELDYVNQENGWTVLHAAVYNNAPLWLARKCMGSMDPARTDARGASVIFTACARDVSAPLLELLLADPRLSASLPTTMGWSPLHVAGFLGTKRETFELLVKYGARDSAAVCLQKPEPDDGEWMGRLMWEPRDGDDDLDPLGAVPTLATGKTFPPVPTVLQLVATGTVTDLRIVKLLLQQAGSRIDRETLERSARHQQLGLLEYLLRVQVLTSLLVVHVRKTGGSSSLPPPLIRMIPKELVYSLATFLYGQLLPTGRT